MTSYNLTSEDFSRFRERLHARRDALAERHRKELGELEMEIISELDKLDAVEETVAEMAAQSPAERQSSKRRKTRNESKAKPAATASSKSRYTAEQNAQIIATADKNALRQLAKEWHRSFGGLEKQRETLLKQRVQVEEPAQSEASSSENPEVSEPIPAALAHAAPEQHRLGYNTGPGTPFHEPTPAPPAPSIFDGHRAIERKPAERGTLVRGITDDGREHPRVLGPGFESAGRE